MRVSIVIPVLNSHEVVRRQLLHFQRIGLPDDVELILVDDGSDPPLTNCGIDVPLTLYATRDTRPWTWALARNAGARRATGEYLLMTDIDHILTRELIEAVRRFDGQKIQFVRQFAVLDKDGVFTQDHAVLVEYGLPAERIADRGLDIKPLPNNFAMRRDIFWELGGYREDLVEKPYPQGEDRLFKKAWQEWMRRTGGKVWEHRPMIYMFPNGQFCGDVDFNPHGLFHDLSRKTNRNMWHKRVLAGERR